MGGAEVLSGSPNRAPLPGDLRVLPEAISSTLHAGVPPFDSSFCKSRPDFRRLGLLF